MGRLDKESEGAILHINSGVLTAIVTSSKHIIEKEYIVNVSERIRPTNVRALSSPMHLEYGKTLPAKVKMINDHTFSIILKEGNKSSNTPHGKQGSFDYRKFKGNLRPGEYRKLSHKEFDSLIKSN